jgi:hypothetical protein
MASLAESRDGDFDRPLILSFTIDLSLLSPLSLYPLCRNVNIPYDGLTKLSGLNIYQTNFGSHRMRTRSTYVVYRTIHYIILSNLRHDCSLQSRTIDLRHATILRHLPVLSLRAQAIRDNDGGGGGCTTDVQIMYRRNPSSPPREYLS